MGGANSVKNLWPQLWTGSWNAHVKDGLENQMHREICAGSVSVEDACREVATDWIAAYKKRFGNSTIYGVEQ